MHWQRKEKICSGLLLFQHFLLVNAMSGADKTCGQDLCVFVFVFVFFPMDSCWKYFNSIFSSLRSRQVTELRLNMRVSQDILYWESVPDPYIYLLESENVGTMGLYGDGVIEWKSQKYKPTESTCSWKYVIKLLREIKSWSEDNKIHRAEEGAENLCCISFPYSHHRLTLFLL